MLDQHFRDLMAGVCAPVTVVTTSDEDGPHGATVSSLASVSLRPALLSIALDRRSGLLSRITGSGRFGINVLNAGQEDVATAFARRDVDRFAVTGWSPSHGLPRLDGTAGWAACDLWQTVEAGDHLILVGRVTHAASVQLAPLVYGYRTFGTHSRFSSRPRRPIADHIAALSC
ncbi:NADH-FMN oxidoreductase RutF, flavin reductase (DIM6/NTAB) family [Amycolatopsis sacchari]|uniref:NADH-FMN oxidoreductase RutF, flavin reductase (DIM6/NTAB) family n=1 Tax=Amycolatopsis sacchari TaxID=115433 RepID=A0A1I4C3V1_9PSEU|nr:flavin reductase family protein [Amycolatopsis sacchari]SFK75453.1 NADH-FMN oxidoreductase RutF, flavin reductase (DIM6/NTAB) family [Amycolatopsis sacchari]